MKAFFAGSFNPFTIGHLNLVSRFRQIFPEVCIAIGYNINKGDKADIEERLNILRTLFADIPGISVISYSGLTAEAARSVNADILVRGFRNAMDAEYERILADTNRELFGIETLMLPSLPSLSYVSSSMVRELEYNGVDTSRFIPDRKDVAEALPDNRHN